MTTKESQRLTSFNSFAELSIARVLKDNLERARFTTPTPIQAAAIGPALDGKDILGTAQTGTGKTLAFILPILECLLNSHVRRINPARSQTPRVFVDTPVHPVRNEVSTGMGRTSNMIEALILVPTRELALQVLDMLQNVGKGTGLSASLAIGGLSELKQLSAIRRGARIIIATPGRLNDYLKRRLISLQTVKILVLDEADRMVDMGFLPQMRSIMNYVPQTRQTMCFCATLNKSIEHLVRDYLKNPVRVEIGSTSKPAESVNLKIYEVAREKKFSLLNHLLNTEKGTFLVFTRTKFGADKLFKKLVQRGMDAAVLHGGKSQPQRSRALEGFKAGKHRVLVATDIAARGIHVHGIAHVINYDMPQATEDFIHRVGRTGRIEETGTATTFVMPEETRDIYAIERGVGKKIERLPLPQNLSVEPRSLHDETADMRSHRVTVLKKHHFGRRRHY